MDREDSDSFNNSIGNGSTLSSVKGSALSLDVEQADTVIVWVDDGTTGSAPASYDISVEAEKKASHFTDDLMRDYEATGSTAFKHEVTTSGSTIEVDLTNQSGSSANFRVFAEALQDTR